MSPAHFGIEPATSGRNEQSLSRLNMMMERLAAIGLGYVGLPVASSLARRSGDVVGFDIDVTRVEESARAGSHRRIAGAEYGWRDQE